MGTGRIETTSDEDYVGSTDAITVEMVEGNLVVKSTTVGIADHFASKGTFKPGITETRTTYRVKKGMLYRDQEEKNYNVDLKRDKKELAGDPITIQDIPVK